MPGMIGVRTISIGGFDTMGNDKKTVEQIEKEFREEMKELVKRGELYRFEKAMDNAMDKFKFQLKSWTEEEIEDDSCNEVCKKKLSKL